MKSIKSLAVISLVLLASKAIACCPPLNLPSEYYLFHLMDRQESVEVTYNINMHENCRLWQEQTLDCFTEEQIAEVVYRFSLETLTQLKEGRIPKEAAHNEFARWLVRVKKDEVLDYLVLAKTCEWLRLEHQSPWYYPCKSDPVKCSLNEVMETALSHHDGPLAERYALQAVRAMTTLRLYEDCVKYWEETVNLFPDGLMRQMIKPYAAGAYYHIGKVDEAKRMFAEMGDVQNLALCENKSDRQFSVVEGMELIYETLPDSPYFKKTIQSILGDMEPDNDWAEYSFDIEPDCVINQLERLCDRVLSEDKVSDPAVWAYTACYISIVKGDDSKADRYLKMAEKTVKDEALEASVKVMRMYIDAQICDYNKAYERKLFEQLTWLQQQVEDNLTDKVCQTAAELNHLSWNFSFYYWNDAMRCILLGTVCPKMLEQGNVVMALQLANMADYTLLNCTGGSMEQYRSSCEFNCYDYSNNFAAMMDTLTADQLEEYVRVVERPKSDFDRFINAHAYADMDFLNEILGTHYIREMRYAEAKKTLSKVSYAFARQTNVYKEHLLDYDPFSYRCVNWEHAMDAKYQFASMMNQCEEEMTQSDNPNRKAQAMIKLAMGIFNSSLYGHSFALSFYQSGSVYSPSDYGEYKQLEQTELMCERAKELRQQAMRMITDDELAAQTQYEFGNLYTVTSWYPETQTAQYVRAHCDRYCDYHQERELLPCLLTMKGFKN